MPYREGDPPEITERVPTFTPPPLPAAREMPRTRLEVCWTDHRKQFDKLFEDRLRTFRNEILSALVAEKVPASAPAPSSARQKVFSVVKLGALKGTRWGGYVSLALTVALLLAKAFKPGLVTPLESLGHLLDGGAP